MEGRREKKETCLLPLDLTRQTILPPISTIYTFTTMRQAHTHSKTHEERPTTYKNTQKKPKQTPYNKKRLRNSSELEQIC